MQHTLNYIYLIFLLLARTALMYGPALKALLVKAAGPDEQGALQGTQFGQYHIIFLYVSLLSLSFAPSHTLSPILILSLSISLFTHSHAHTLLSSPPHLPQTLSPKHSLSLSRIDQSHLFTYITPTTPTTSIQVLLAVSAPSLRGSDHSFSQELSPSVFPWKNQK